VKNCASFFYFVQVCKNIVQGGRQQAAGSTSERAVLLVTYGASIGAKVLGAWVPLCLYWELTVAVMPLACTLN
jgi:hypothetical protein